MMLINVKMSTIVSNENVIKEKYTIDSIYNLTTRSYYVLVLN